MEILETKFAEAMDEVKVQANQQLEESRLIVNRLHDLKELERKDMRALDTRFP
jgi:hypothetical protein